VSVGVLAVCTTLVAGCAGTKHTASYDRYCADQTANTRVSDDHCGASPSTTGARYGWYYARAGRPRPLVGARVSGGSYDPPASGGGGHTGSGGRGRTGGSQSGGGSHGGGHGSVHVGGRH
jgi:hypothetical protein